MKASGCDNETATITTPFASMFRLASTFRHRCILFASNLFLREHVSPAIYSFASKFRKIHSRLTSCGRRCSPTVANCGGERDRCTRRTLQLLGKFCSGSSASRHSSMGWQDCALPALLSDLPHCDGETLRDGRVTDSMYWALRRGIRCKTTSAIRRTNCECYVHRYRTATVCVGR